jgi:hypothetical protein
MVLEARQAGADFSHFYIFAVAETLSLFFFIRSAQTTQTLFGLSVVGWVSHRALYPPGSTLLFRLLEAELDATATWTTGARPHMQRPMTFFLWRLASR